MATASTAAVTRFVRPLQTSDTRSAKITVLGIYKEFQRLTSESWWDFQLTDIPLPVLREAIKKEFTKNGHLKDLRVIDRKVGEARAHLASVRYNYYNQVHIRNMLFAENIEPKPKDFLSKFLQRKD